MPHVLFGLSHKLLHEFQYQWEMMPAGKWCHHLAGSRLGQGSLARLSYWVFFSAWESGGGKVCSGSSSSRDAGQGVRLVWDEGRAGSTR